MKFHNITIEDCQIHDFRCQLIKCNLISTIFIAIKNHLFQHKKLVVSLRENWKLNIYSILCRLSSTCVTNRMIYNLSIVITPSRKAPQSEPKKVFNIKHSPDSQLNDDVWIVTTPIISRLFTSHQLLPPCSVFCRNVLRRIDVELKNKSLGEWFLNWVLIIYLLELDGHELENHRANYLTMGRQR